MHYVRPREAVPAQHTSTRRSGGLEPTPVSEYAPVTRRAPSFGGDGNAGRTTSTAASLPAPPTASRRPPALRPETDACGSGEWQHDRRLSMLVRALVNVPYCCTAATTSGPRSWRFDARTPAPFTMRSIHARKIIKYPRFGRPRCQFARFETQIGRKYTRHLRFARTAHPPDAKPPQPQAAAHDRPVGVVISDDIRSSMSPGFGPGSSGEVEQTMKDR